MSEIPPQLVAALADRYRIERPLGAGGMATVYLAEDLKHKRKVAVKVLRPELSEVLGAERFVQEITTTANLHHPHILPLFDSGRADSFLYYVMPFIDGETLRAKLNREKQLGIEEAVKIATDVADALDYAHRHNIIHRDIKPENILLHDGRPLVADFGIALAVSVAGGTRITGTGMSVGTPYYMSPEQALGERELDARSDVYALGVVLYEMLSGSPPFAAATGQGVLAKIIAEPVPSLRVERPSVPDNIESAIGMALEKLPADRFPSAKAFADALANPGFVTPARSRAVAALRARGSWRERLAIPALGLAAVLLVLAGWLMLTRPAEPEHTVLRYRMALPPQQSLQRRYASRIALSPDGSRLVFVGPGPQGVQLWVQERNALEPTPIPGTDGAGAPFFSPDGQRVAFLNVGRQSLHAVALEGGAMTVLVPSGVRRTGASWGREGIVYVDETKGLVRLREGADSATVLIGLDDVTDPRWPHQLPDGGGVLFTHASSEAGGQREIALLAEPGRTAQPLVRGLVGMYTSEGYLVYVTVGGELMAAPFDPRRGELADRPVVITRNLEIQLDAVDLAVSHRGTLMYGTRAATVRAELVITDRAGTVRVLDRDWQENFQTVAWSPDGRKLAVTVIDSLGQQTAVWIKPIGGGLATRLTLDPAEPSYRGVWHPGGQTVGYVTDRGDTRVFFQRRADGSGEPRIGLGESVNQAEWSRDGAWLIYRTGRVDDLDIFAQRLRDSLKVAVAATPNVNEHSGTISPDGRWVAFVSNRSGVWEIYVRPFPETSRGEWQVSSGGGTEPRWSRSGRELFYKQGGRLMAAEVRGDSILVVGSRASLFPVDIYYNFVFHPTYDVSPDDRGFAMIRPLSTSNSFDITVVEHWTREPGLAR